MSAMYQKSQWTFYSMYSFILFIAILKAAMFYVVIQLLLKLDLTKPFNPYVAKKIMTIGYYALSIGTIFKKGVEIQTENDLTV